MKRYLATLLAKGSLSAEETQAIVESFVGPSQSNATPIEATPIEMKSEQVTDAQIGAYLMHTASRPITAEELVGAARCLRTYVRAVPIRSDVPLLDTCGTGGSGFETFNTSTAVAFVCAGAGQPVAKHGNRAASSKSGSADVLEKIGITLELPPELLAKSLERTGFCFMFAPLHHPATRRVASVRKELGVRTIFNFLGPLVNPAQARYQLLGVSSEAMLEPMAAAIEALGIERALVVRGADGLDELTLTGSSTVIEVGSAASIRRYTVHPGEFGLSTAPMSAVSVSSSAESAQILREVLQGEKSAYRDLVLLNSGAALYAAGKAASINDGIAVAAQSIDNGKAQAVLDDAIAFCRESSV